MRIGIFGDSFASNGQRSNPTASWIDLLSGMHKVERFGQAGSGLYYSAKLFLENHHLFDKIIFVVTDPCRLYLPDHKIDRFSRHIAGLSNAEARIADLKNNDLNELKILTAAKDYFLYLQNSEYDRYVYDLTINDILSKRSDTILIPTVRQVPDDFYKSKSVMFDISLKELNSWSKKIDWLTMIDCRHAHMSEENNEIFFKNVLKWLSGTPVNIDIDDYVQPKYLDFYLESKI